MKCQRKIFLSLQWNVYEKQLKYVYDLALGWPYPRDKYLWNGVCSLPGTAIDQLFYYREFVCFMNVFRHLYKYG